jgi:hypothetical protein
MRFRTFVLWAAGLSVLGWAGYTAVSASTDYLAAREMVDQVLQESSSRLRAGTAAGSQQSPADLAADVQATLLIRARRHGIPIEERDLAVFAEGRGLTVKLKWSYPVISYRGGVILLIPMSLERATRIQ